MKTEYADKNIHRVAIAILLYFRSHPAAENNASGIAQWWVHEDVRLVREALSALVTEGKIAKRANVYYLKHKP